MTTISHHTDRQIQEEVINELDFEPRVHAEHIGVSVQDGIVTLTGKASSWIERWEAEQAALRIRGVKGVADEITVDLPAVHVRDDTDIAHEAVRALEANLAVPHDKIKLKVNHGVVTLTGEVRWYYERTAAEQTVRPIVGVRSLVNLINIAPQPRVDAVQVKREISRAFHRHATLDAKNVQVDVSLGKVTLRGRVRSWAEREYAQRAAWAMSGVHEVDNQLEISYDA